MVGTPEREETGQTTGIKKGNEQHQTVSPAEEQPPSKEDEEYPNMGKNGKLPPRSRPGPNKPRYRPAILDYSRPVAADGQKHFITSAGEPISGDERSPMPKITANCDGGNRTCTSQSTVLPVLLEAECSVQTVLHATLDPINGVPTATRTPSAQRIGNPTRSSTEKYTEEYQRQSTPAP